VNVPNEMVWNAYCGDTRSPPPVAWPIPPRRGMAAALPLAPPPIVATLDPMLNPNRRSKRGRKPILTPAQKRTLVRMVRQAFKAELRRWGKKW
jgi:hypothetical protein